MNENRRRRRNGKHEKIFQRKTILLVICASLLILAAVGTTIAFLITGTDKVENTFTPSMISTEIEEDFDNIEKKDVKVKNTGDTEVYVRAAVIVTWMDNDGNVAADLPKEDDYIISYNESDWMRGSDGYWYHKQPVAAGSETAVLINSCKLAENAKAPQGYYLSVEIVASAIQSTPTSAVVDNWGVTLNDGAIAGR